MKWTGSQNCNFYEAKNLKHEKVASLPAFTALHTGIVLLVTTPGPDYGMWFGGVAAWERFATGGGGSATTVIEEKTVAVTNVIPPLNYTPTDPSIAVFAGGLSQRSGVDYTLSGNVVVWNPALSGIDLTPGDIVTVIYKV